MNANYRWHYEPSRELSLTWGEFTLWTYRFATDRRKAYIHPLHTAGGTLLSCLEPWDHVWHRGLWFSWKYLNGINYWEERGQTGGEPEGDTEFAGGETVKFQADRAHIETRFLYRPPGGASVLAETRGISFGLPRSDGSYIMDWRHTFSAEREPVTVDRTPINEKTPWGGYAGLSWRAARSLGQFKALNSEGLRDKQAEHQRARWLDLSGLSDGGRNRYAGLAMFDHPANLRHPSHWRCINDPGFGYINPAFVLSEPFVIHPGKPLILVYRVMIHDGVPDSAALEREWQDFAKTT